MLKELGLLEPGTLHLDVRRVDNLPEKDKGQKNSLSVMFELGPNVDKNKKNKDGAGNTGITASGAQIVSDPA